MVSRPPLLVLVGPTGVGKTAVAVRLARQIALEVIGADSRQVYRGMDIGTGKPTAAERAAAPHHLVDVVDPSERYHAARFRADALAAIAGVQERGHLAVVVGGTGLYVRALLRGLTAAPPADPALRATLESFAAEHGAPALHARLAAVAPDAARRLHPNDRVRVIRALEVNRSSLRTDFHRSHGVVATSRTRMSGRHSRSSVGQQPLARTSTDPRCHPRSIQLTGPTEEPMMNRFTRLSAILAVAIAPAAAVVLGARLPDGLDQPTPPPTVSVPSTVDTAPYDHLSAIAQYAFEHGLSGLSPTSLRPIAPEEQPAPDCPRPVHGRSHRTRYGEIGHERRETGRRPTSGRSPVARLVEPVSV